MGLFDSLGGNPSQTTTQNTSNTTGPSAMQMPYLQSALQNAQSIYNQGAGNLYNGPQVATYTPDQQAIFNQMIGAGGNQSIPGQTAGYGSAMAGAGANGIQNAIQTLQQFQPQGGTQSNIDAAHQYASGQNIQPLVDAAMTAENRQASEQTLPQIARNAAAGGDINSNRTAIQQGLVQRGLATDAGNIGANLEGQLYGQGLGLAQQNSEAQNNARLAALTGGASASGTAANLGTNALNSSVDQSGNLFNIAQGGVQGANVAQQAGINNAVAMNQYAPNRLNSLLQQYFGVAGQQGTYGQTSTGTQSGTSTSNPGLFGYLGLGANLAGSAMKAYTGGSGGG